MVTRFTKVGGGVTAHSHVRLQFRYLRNRSALTLKSHQKQTYLFRARSFIAKHGVLLVLCSLMYISYAFMGYKSSINYFCPFLVLKKKHPKGIHFGGHECIMKIMLYTKNTFKTYT